MKADLLRNELGINTWYDLLQHYPIRYIDRTRFYKINELKTDMHSAQIKGTLISVKEEGIGRKKRLKGIYKDETDL